MNPLHAVPTLKDGDFCLAESNAILRYMAEAYANEFYPTHLEVRGQINWAMDRFSSTVYSDFVKTVYPCLGFAQAPEDRASAGKACSQNFKEFCGAFLKGKFVAGDKLSIADFKVAPFLFAFDHPMVKEQSFVDVPDRVRQFDADFAVACPASGMLSAAGGYAIKEMLDDIIVDDRFALPTSSWATAAFRKASLRRSGRPRRAWTSPRSSAWRDAREVPFERVLCLQGPRC